jgi:hypothetical protein
MGRAIKVADNDSWDWYLKPRDGRLAPLRVQATTRSRFPTDSITWERADLEDITPLSIKLVYWCMGSVKELIQQQPTLGRGSQPPPLPNGRGGFAGSLNIPHTRRTFMDREWRKEYFGENWRQIYWRYPLTCIGLLVLVSFIPLNL